MYDSFEEWFDALLEVLRIQYDYQGNVDQGCMLEDYESGFEPHESAKSLIEDLYS